MLTAEAIVETDRAGRYLTQLCRHAGQMRAHVGHRPGGHEPPEVEDVELSGDRGVLTLAIGRCVMEAGPAALTLTAEAEDEESLARIKSLITARLEKIGRRDGLQVRWGTEEPVRRRGRRNWILLGVLGVLALALHFGLAWTPWAANLVLAVIAVKAALLGWHAIRRRRRSAQGR